MEILELLEARSIPYQSRGSNEYAIQCLNLASHRNGDLRPSLSINVEKHQAHCFVCGFSMNEERLTRWLLGGELDDFSIETLAIKARIRRLETQQQHTRVFETTQVLLPPGSAWNEDGYRGISIETYNRLGAIKCERGYYSNRIVFPVYLGGELIGVDARALSDDVQPKYLRNKNCSCKTEWLYPYDIVRESKPKYVILVEGIYDSINLLDKGFSGLCIFGTENFSMSKLRLLLATGCEEVVLFFDKDDAGQEAQRKVGKVICEWMECSEAELGDIPVDPLSSLAKGKLVYQDCGDLSKEQLLNSINNRKKFKI